MGVGSEHEVEELVIESAETGVEIGIGDVVGGMSCGEAIESGSGVGDDGGDSDKRGAGSIIVDRWDAFAGEDKEDEVGIWQSETTRSSIAHGLMSKIPKKLENL